MEIILKKYNKIKFRNLELNYVESEKLDDNAIHLITEEQVNVFFVNDTELNGVTYNNADELINALNTL